MPSKLKICTSFSGLSRKTFRNYIVFLLKTSPWSLFCSGYWPLIWTGRTGLFLVSQILKKISFYDTICYRILDKWNSNIWYVYGWDCCCIIITSNLTMRTQCLRTSPQLILHSESRHGLIPVSHPLRWGSMLIALGNLATAMNVHIQSAINYNLAILFWTLWWVGAQGA